MPEVLEILKYTLPALLVFLTAYLLIRSMIINERQRRSMDISTASQKTVLPIRLQAYERVIILLERISPEAVLMRISPANKKSGDFRLELLSVIRSEIEHNLSQQLYLSPEAWEMVKSARNNCINLINNAASHVKPDAPAQTLSSKILEMMSELTVAPTSAALDFVKKEARGVF